MKFQSDPSPPAFVVLAAILMFASACGTSSGEADVGVASLNDDAESISDEADTVPVDTIVEAPENPEDAFALFNECMTEAGFDFGAAVTFGSGGDATGRAIEIEPGGAILGHDADPQQSAGSFEDFDPEAFDEANEACRGHLANLDGAFDVTPEQEAAFEDAQLEWSECMRDQGVDVPEFDGSGGITIVRGPAEGADPQSGAASFEDSDFDFERFEEAAEICRSVYDQFDELEGLFNENRTNG